MEVWKSSNIWNKLKRSKFYSGKIKSRFKSGNACYHPARNILSYSWLSNSSNIKNKRSIILSVVFYGYETWSFTLMEEGRLRVFENRILRRIHESRRDDLTDEWIKLRNERFNGL